MNANNATRVDELNSDIERNANALEMYARYIGTHASDEDCRGLLSHIQMAIGALSLLSDNLTERERLKGYLEEP